MEEEIRQLEGRIKLLENLIFQLIKSDYYFSKHLILADGVNIKLSSGTGTKFGTSASEKIGFHGKSPVAQQATIADADGTLDDATTKINAILDVLDAYGLTA